MAFWNRTKSLKRRARARRIAHLEADAQLGAPGRAWRAVASSAPASTP